MAIVQEFLENKNTLVILNLGKDRQGQSGYPDLLPAISTCQEQILVQNFGESALKDDDYEENFRFVNDELRKLAEQQGREGPWEDCKSFCVDFGLPFPDDPNKPKMWNPETGQADWLGLLEEGGADSV